MKSKINIILPIAVAVILPLVGIYSAHESGLQYEHGYVIRWFSRAIIVYTLWHMLWFLSSMTSKYKSWKYVFILIISFVFIYGISYLLDINHKMNYVRLMFTLILLLIIQYVMKSQQDISNLLLEKEQLQTENYKSQLKALRNQIDPHFLFNSLNTLRSMVRQQHTNSEKFIISLSDFYRQVLKHNENTTLPLEEEVRVLQAYLFLMQNRNEKAISIQQNIDAALDQFHLPTLALQVVVENCFKHNSMTSKMPLHIEINNTDDFSIIVKNNIQPKIGDIQPSGYGLELLRKRYELMNITQGVIIEKTVHQFSVKLKLIRK